MRLITKAKLHELLSSEITYTFLVLDITGGDKDELIVDGSINLAELAKQINDFCSGVENSSAKENFAHEHDPIAEHEHGGEAGGA